MTGTDEDIPEYENHVEEKKGLSERKMTNEKI